MARALVPEEPTLAKAKERCRARPLDASGSGEGKVTRFELLCAGVADLNPEVLAWIRVE